MAAVSQRYARAFADVVGGMRLDGDSVQREIAAVAELLDQSVELRRIWQNPAIPAQQKVALLDAIASRITLSKPVRNFVAVIIGHRRISLLPDIERELRAELDRRSGITEAEVVTARELGEDERMVLELNIAGETGTRVRATYRVNADLLGGAVVRVGSTIYDGSVRGQLQKIKERLTAG
ncbi:MAG TPA: ATP synthase F1 subunit delta [Terriglobales bacterium]|nr:ATP synthase F1 subunit delta [Terriglobales bacterium]